MSIRIGIGGSIGSQLAPADYWRWIDLCEDSGIDSIWHSDQLVGETLEPLAMLAALAARTSRMRFGTNALVLSFRDPVVTAKQFATIDYLSGGRLLPVFGVGRASDPWFAATGTDTRSRGARANEAIALIRMLLERDEVSFSGTHYRYEGPGIYPRPAKPMPLWIGGQSAAAVKRTALLGDGWLGGLTAPDEAGATRRHIEAALAETGRTIDDDHFGVTLPMRIGSPEDPSVARMRARFYARMPDDEKAGMMRSFAVGSEEDVIALLRQHVAAGMSKFVMIPIADTPDDLLEQTRRLAEAVLPAIEDR
ncbi:MAG: LLM class flavin-dependent oxidoreductase [Novosphingobium sp.]|nr:LLM class flavin-dependent oxidoreductase [Novosphingobium sp.]